MADRDVFYRLRYSSRLSYSYTQTSCGSHTLPQVRSSCDCTLVIVVHDAWINSSIGLVAKPFAPRVPLFVLTLAGALPDAAFFVLQFLGIETFNFDASIAKHGCFPYTNDYPYTHSLAGMVACGVFLQ